MAKTIIYNSSTASTVFDTDNIAVNESNGDRYVNDRDSSTIYKIDSNGAITTFLTGYQWNVIRFIGGFLYASSDNSGVHKINPTNAGITRITSTVIPEGTISSTGTVVAGGNGSGSAANQFNLPFDIDIDSSGNVYVADYFNKRIQKWATGATTGTTVFTITGSLSQIFSVFVDSNGDIYYSINDNAVWKYTVSTSTHTKVAGGVMIGGSTAGNGQSNSQLNAPTDIHIDSSGNIYVADRNSDRVMKWTSGGTSGVKVAGSGQQGSSAGLLNDPSGIAFDSSGNLYVADSNNHRIQKFAGNSVTNTSGTVVAGGNGQGSGANQFNYPTGIAFDSFGNLYVADQYNHRIQKFAPNSTSSTNGTTVMGGNGAGANTNQLNRPHKLVIDSSNNLYVADTINYRMVKGTYTAGTGGNATNQLHTPKGFHVFNSDESYVADSINNRVMYWTTSASVGTQLVGSLNAAEDVTVDSSGNLIVCDTANHKVLKYSKTATNTFNQTPTVIAGGNGSGSALNQLASPTFVKSNSDGSIIVLDNGNDRVVKWTSGATTGVVISDSYSAPSDLYVYGNGNLLISDVGNDTITLDTGLTVAPTMAITSTFSSGGTNGASTIALTFTSSLSTANFTVNDITVSGGSLSNFSATSNTVYTATFTPSGSGSKSISVGANAYTDTAWGNNNTASNTFTYTHAVAPVISNTSLTSNNALANTRAKVGDVITLTFVSDININSPTVSFTSGGQEITNSVTVTGSNTSWTATYTVNSSDTEGAVAISITATSTAGTQASAHTTISSGSVTMDKTNPAWSSIAPSGNTSVNTSAVQYTLSETLSSGTVTFTPTGGSAASSVVVSLTGAELNAGTRSLATLTNAPTLVNNAIYSIVFSGVDLYGNTSSTSTQTGVTFNNVLPTITSVTSTTNDGYYNLGDAINITVNFSDAVTLSDTGGGSTEMVVTLETGSTDRTVTITSISGASSASGTYTVQAGDTSSDLSVKTIALGTNDILSNTAGNMTNFTIGSNLNTTSAIVIDTTAPVISNTSPSNSSTVLNKNIGYTLSEQCTSGTVVFTRTGGSTTDIGSPHTVNLVSSELTSGVHVPAVLFNNPTLVSGSIYSIAYNVTDLAGNTATAITNTGITYVTDTTSPTITITSNDVVSGGLSNLETIVLIFTISEVVTNFVVGDITVSGGALSGFTGSGKNYAVTFTPSGNGAKTIDVAAGAFTDGTNNNLAATQFSYTYDGTKPTVAITSSQVSHNGSFGGTEIGLTFTTSEATINFELEDIVVSNGTLSNFSATSSTVYTATFTPLTNGDCNINVYADVFTDAANNLNTSSIFTWTKTGTNPTIAITSTIAKFGSTSSASIPLTFTTSASTSNFVVGDIKLIGGAISNFTGSGTSYTAVFTPSDSGVQVITVPANSFTNSDSAGNEQGQFIYTFATPQIADPAAGTVTNFVKRNVLKATVTTENGQSCELTDLNFYYENGVSSADVLPNGSAFDGLEMVGTIIEVELEMKDNSIPDVVESVMIGSWSSMGH